MAGSGIPRCLQVSAVLFVENRQEGIRRGRRRRKKTVADQLELSDPAASYSQLVNRRVDWQQLPDPELGSYAL
jgi:hypothetical protein